MTAATPSELEEMVARAMFKDACDSGGHINGYLPFDQQPELTRRYYECQARAALAVVREALREPSDSIVDAAWAAFFRVEPNDGPSRGDVRISIKRGIAASPLGGAP